MLYYAVVFFVIALIAAVFGFGGIAAGAAGIAKILFFVFLVSGRRVVLHRPLDESDLASALAAVAGARSRGGSEPTPATAGRE